jgi:hypothetical protein
MAPGVVVGAVAVALVSSAALALGFPVRQLDLNDTGIWVSADTGGQFGRVNKAALALDARVSPPGVRVPRYQLDVLQDGNLVFGWDQTNAVLTRVDTALSKPLADQAIAADATTAVAVRGGTLALMNRLGQLWATHYDPVSGSVNLGLLNPSTPPLASLELGADVPAGGAAMTVDADGRIWMAGVNGRLISLDPLGDGFAPPKSATIPALKSVAITTVGASPVVLDATAGQLVLPDGRTVSVVPDAATRLQQSGPDAEAVLVANTKGLVRVKLASAEVVPVFSETQGAPAAPVRLGGCDFGAWAGGTGRVVRFCDGGQVEPRQVTGGLDRPTFRINRDQVLLNDQTDGTTYDLDTDTVIDWPQPKPPIDKQDQKQETGADVQPKPKAVDDNLKARAERTTVLHLLDNDTDTVGGVLTIQSIDTGGVPNGVDLQISPDGQTVKLFLPNGVSAVNFTYTVSDGADSSVGHVTVTDAGQSETKPTLRPNYAAPKLAVPSFGTLMVPVISDWRDDEGDPVTVVSARTDDGQIVPVTPDGQLNYTADEADADLDRTITYNVTDGVDAKTTAERIKVKVLGTKATRGVPAVAQPDSARGEVGKPITIYPLNNDTPGADPTNLNAKLALNGDINAKAHLKVTTDAKSGRVTVVADQAGPYFLDYTAEFGNTAPVKGLIRVDAFASSTASEPVAMPDQVSMRGATPILADVLANDYDPLGNLLTVQSATPVSRGEVQVQVISGRWLRILPASEHVSPNPQVIHYTISNGSQTASGDVLVTQLPAVEQDRPLPYKDAATVRVGDSVLIPVLGNDTSLSGRPLSLATDDLGTDHDGQLPVFDRAKRADEDQGDVGQAFVRGNQIRYIAPATVDGTRQVVISYTVQTASGDTAESMAVVTVKPEPSADRRDAAPVANTVETRVVSGSRVRISIPTSGQDPDGDSVVVTGLASAPSLGRVVAISPNSLTYEAYPIDGMVGTDSFRYEVADKYGRTGTGVVRVAVTAPGQTQPPVAIDDQLTTRPGANVQLNVMGNDFTARDDAVTITPLTKANNPVPDGVSLASDTGPLLAKAPEVTEQPVVVNYALTGNGGTGPSAVVSITSKVGYNNPPVVVDQVAEASGNVGKVSLLADVWDVDDPVESLTAALATPVEGATLVGKDLTVPLLDRPQVIPFTVSDPGGAMSAAVVYVPAAGTGAPHLKVDASIQIATDTTASFAIGDYVESPRGKPVKIASARADASPSEDLDAKVDDAGRFTLTSKNHYVGPAAVTLDVMDGSSQTDEGVLTATVTIPVQVGAPTPVLRCPEDPQTIVQGGEIKNLDITSLCHVWSPDPGTLGNLTYSAGWAQPIDQVSASGGGHQVKLEAGGGAPENGEGVITVGIEGTAAATDTLQVVVVPADPPRMRSVNLTDIKATSPVKVPISLISPLRDAQTKVLEIRQTSGGKAATSVDQASVSITPDVATFGKLTFEVKATDLASDPGRESRWVTGTVSMVVYTRPDPPSAPQDGPTVQSHAATLSWTPGNANGAPIDSYELKIASGPGAGKTITCRSTPCRVTGLKNGEDFTFQVRAHNKADWSEWSPSSAVITPDIAPGAPAWVKVSDPQDHSVLVSWGPIANDGSAIKVIHVTAAGVTKDVAASAKSVRIATPSNNSEYTFSVAGENDFAIGPAVSDRGQSSGKPTGLSVNTPNPGPLVGATTNVTVSWSLSSPEGPTPVTYDVERSDGKRICSDVTATSCVDDTVQFDGTSYTYSVTATNATGGAAHSTTTRSSSWTAVGTPDDWANTWSAAPTGADGTATLTFTVPPSRGATSNVTLLRSGKSSVSVPSPGPAGGARTFTTTGLTDGTETTLTLRVCNESGRCSTSNPRTVTTFGQLVAPKVSATHSADKVTGTASGNGNGATATLTLYIDGVKVGSTSGKGSLSITKTRTVGYSNKVTVKATLTSDTDPPRADKSASTTETTGPKPPSPSVSITSTLFRRCTTQSGGVYYCALISATVKNFSGSPSCTLHGSGVYPGDPNPVRVNAYDKASWNVQADRSVYVSCDGVRSATITSN